MIYSPRRPAPARRQPRPPSPRSRVRPLATGAPLLLALCLGWWPPAAAAEAPSTLLELVQAALATNQQMKLAESNLRRAFSDVKLTSSALLPRAELNGQWTRFGQAQTVEFAPGQEFVITPLTDWNWSADVRQTLFYGLRDWRARNVALLRRDIARLQETTTASDLTLEVAASFLQAVADAERVGVEHTALEQNRAQLRVAERRYEVGELTVADVARWRAEVAAAEQRVVTAEGNAELSRRRLARIAGVPEVGELHPAGPVPVPSGDDAELVARALDERLEMTTLRHQLEAAGLMIKISKGGWLPTLDAHAQYFQQKSIFPSRDWVSLMLSVRVPIYDGGLTAAQVVQAKEDLRQVQITGEELEKQIADQVEAAAIGYRAATASEKAAEERSLAAREAYRQVERAYRVGEASSTDLLVATSAQVDAETSRIIARAQRSYDAIALRRAVGLPPLPDLELPQTDNEDAS